MPSQGRLFYVLRGLSAWDSGITVQGHIGETASYGHLEEAFLLLCAAWGLIMLPRAHLPSYTGLAKVSSLGWVSLVAQW